MKLFQKSLLLFCSVSILLIGFISFVKADSPPVPINLEIEGPDSTLYSGSLQVPACSTLNSNSSTVNGFCAFAAAGLAVDASWYPYGGLINSVNGIAGDSKNYWLWFLNGEPAQTSIDNYELKPGDNILWALKRKPLKINFSSTSPQVNATTTITVFGFNPQNFDFEPVAGASLVGASAVTDASGKAEIVATSTNPFDVSVVADGFIPSRQFTITPQPEKITLTIRGQNTTAFSENVTLPSKNSPNIPVSPTGDASTIPVSQRSVLGILEALQSSSTDFAITDLSYSKTFGSFLINCIAVPSGNTTPDCYNWTDAINGTYPQVGIDHQMLNDGDVIYLFFGSPHQTILSKTSAATGESFTAIAKQYDLTAGKYKPLAGVVLGVGTQNPDFTFTEIATSTSDNNGQAVFTLNTAGTFAVGIKDDYYFPSTAVTITAATNSAGDQIPGGGGSITHPNFNIADALAFLSSNQNADGFFDSPISTDWTAIAFASADPGPAKTKLARYLLNGAPGLNSITDYERRALALEALGINPYSGTSVNLISAIASSFNGTRIGTPGDNGDIFALLVLEHAGYSPSDDIIKKEAAFVLSCQHPNGSWDESPDLTAAATQSLIPLPNVAGASSAITQAAKYLSQTQQLDGGWGNPDSTSWVQTAINGLIEAHMPNLDNENIWTSSGGFLPTDALAKAQKPDGSINSPNSVWSTSYAVAAASGKSWATILGSFPRQRLTTGSSNTNNEKQVLGMSTSTTQSLPAQAATTTLEDAAATLASPANQTSKTPSTAVALSPRPKLKIGKGKTKIPRVPRVPAVPGQAVPKLSGSPKQGTDLAALNHPGTLKKIWNALIFFLSRLF